MVGYAVILRDITESRRSTEETIQSERLTALTLLAAGVAHEIGNPLNSLHIHLQLMERKLRKVPDGVRKDLAKRARRGAGGDHAPRLDRAAISRRHPARAAGRRGWKISMCSCRRASPFSSPRSTTANILVEQELRADLPLLEVDRDQLKQAFYNVIKNAFQAMKTERDPAHPHGPRGRTSSGSRFADTGGGISPENMSKIFEPYFTTKASGSGLGLLIVRRIVREHGGEIELMSDAGEGLTLTIRLPLRDQRMRMLGPGEANPE